MDREEAMKPRVLLVEDDPVSRAFFQGVLGTLPVVVDATDGCAGAERCAARFAHALWLVDAHLPDGDAIGLLARLRRHGRDTVALAHTASRCATLHGALLAAGFAEVLRKPIATGALLSAAGRHLRLPVREPARPCWDDAAAAAALGGEAAHVQALRGLFLSDLQATVDAVASAIADGDADAARAVLHRLESACAFTGAGALLAAVRTLRDAPADPVALAALQGAAAALLTDAGCPPRADRPAAPTT